MIMKLTKDKIREDKDILDDIQIDIDVIFK